MKCDVVSGAGAELVSLLARYIEEKWASHVHEDQDILGFVLTWGPMVNYFKRSGMVVCVWFFVCVFCLFVVVFFFVLPPPLSNSTFV
jgi:hypothetical protein